ncbi:MAG: hypothetical protein ABSB12_01260 [Candidatus Saccharimonadales bacterium]|jgi:hypothetical protein
MTATNHAVSGALIAVYIHEPIIALPLALASHFVLDGLPHLGIKKHNSQLFAKVLIVDITVASLILLGIVILQPAYWLLMFSCAILAMSPDLMWLPLYIRELKHLPAKSTNWLMRFHGNIQWGERSWGYLIEIPWFVLTFILLIVSIHDHRSA